MNNIVWYSRLHAWRPHYQHQLMHWERVSPDDNLNRQKLFKTKHHFNTFYWCNINNKQTVPWPLMVLSLSNANIFGSIWKILVACEISQKAIDRGKMWKIFQFWIICWNFHRINCCCCCFPFIDITTAIRLAGRFTWTDIRWIGKCWLLYILLHMLWKTDNFFWIFKNLDNFEIFRVFVWFLNWNCIASYWCAFSWLHWNTVIQCKLSQYWEITL